MINGLTGVMELRAQLRMDAGLDGFFNDQYGKSAKHLVTFKFAPVATDYPFICYVPLVANRGGLGGDLELVSLIVGVKNDAFTDDVADGVLAVAAAEALILDAINSHWTAANTTFLGTVKTQNDIWTGHPFYQKELQVPLKVKRLI